MQTPTLFRPLLAACFLAGVTISPADARRVVINDPWPTQERGNCAAILGVCALESLPFQVRIGTQTYGSIAVYDDGFVAFGGSVDFEVLYSPLPVETWGSPVIVTSLGLIDDFDYPMVFSEFSSSGTEFRVQWYGGAFDPPAGYLGPDTGGPYDVTFTRGENLQSLTLTRLASGDVQVNVQGVQFGGGYGYALGDQLMPLEYGNGGESFSVLLAAPDAVVPEPASWAMMITGFGIVGSALRRRKPIAA